MRETVTEYEVEQREIETERIYCDDCGAQTDDPTFEAREVCDGCRTVEDDSRVAQTREQIDDAMSEFGGDKIEPIQARFMIMILAPLIILDRIYLTMIGNVNAKNYLPIGLGNVLWGIVIGTMIGVYVL